MSIPRIAVGLPVFDGEALVGGAIDTVLQQTIHDVDLIISDNASTDRTADVCLERASRDPRIHYFRNASNIGIMENFAAVAQRADRELFCWIGADDRWEPTFLETLARALDAAPAAALAWCNYDWRDEEGTVARSGSTRFAPRLDWITSRRLCFHPAQSRVQRLLLYWIWRNPFPIYGLFRRCALTPFLPFEYLFDDCRHADNLFLLRFLTQHAITTVEETLFHYREKRRTCDVTDNYYRSSSPKPSVDLNDEQVLRDRFIRAIQVDPSIPPRDRLILRLAIPLISRARASLPLILSRRRRNA